jgi:hypothetical protein
MVSPDTIRTAIGIIGASPVPVSTHGSGNHVVDLMAALLHGHVGCRLTERLYFTHVVFTNFCSLLMQASRTRFAETRRVLVAFNREITICF